MKALRITGIVLCLVSFSLGGIWAQAPTGSVSGVVTDDSGAVIPNAKITVTNRETGAARELISAGNGSYSVPALQAGNYAVRVEAAGFQTRERVATVAVGSATRVDFLMHVGATKDVIMVEDAAPQLNYETQSVSGVVSRTQIQDLPLNGRSFLNLASIEPGVSVGIGSTSQYNAQFSVSIMGSNGGRTAYTVDGGNVRDTIENTGPSQNFSQEVVQEFQVSSVNFDLSTGITAAGSVNIVTRSGGNKFHGSGYFFFRDHNMSAYPGLRRPTDPIAVHPLCATPSSAACGKLQDPFFARRNPGFWFGGPIKRDRTFFFFNFEHQNQEGAVNFQPSNITSVAQLVGTFTTPYTGKTLSARFDHKLSDRHQAFARYSHDGNNSFGPQGNPALPSNWLVNSNFSDLTTFGLTSTFTASTVNDFRFNYQYWHNRNLFPDNSSCPGCLGLEGIAPQIGINGTNVTIGHTANATQGRDLRQFQFNDTLSWTKGNHRWRFGGEYQHAPGTGFWGFCDPFCATVATPELVRSSLTGANAAAIPVYFPKLPTVIRTYDDILNLPFLGAVVGIGDPSQPPPYNVDQAKANDRVRFYAQDTWRIRPNFSLNYGLAWNFESKLFNFDLGKPAFLAPIYGSDLTPTNNNNRNFSPSLGFNWSPFKDNKTTIRGGFGIYYDTAQLYQRLQERAYTGPIGNGRILDSSGNFKNTFAGVIDFSAGGIPVANGAAVPVGRLISLTLGQFVSIYQAQIGARQAALAPKTDLAVRNIDISKTGAQLYAKDYPMLHSMHFNIGFQRQITRDMALTVDVVRRVGLNVDLGEFDFNRFNRYVNRVQTPVIPKCTAAQVASGASSTPGVNCSNGAITFWNPGGRSVYNGILVKLDKRFSHRYQFTASYSLAQRHEYSGGFFNMDNWAANWAPVGGRHNLNVVATIDAGWGVQLGLITSVSSKGPTTATVGGFDLDGDGNTNNILPGTTINCINRGCGDADIVAGVNLWNSTWAGKVDARCANPDFTSAANTCSRIPALKIPTNFFFGRTGFSQDLRVTKTFKFRTENWKFQVFGEVFNVFNYANLGGSSSTLDPITNASSAFGVPTSRSGQVFGSGGPRAFQVGGRVSF